MSVGQRGRAAAPASYGLVIGLRFVLALRFVGLGLVLLYICDLDRFLQFWKQANEKGWGGEGCPHTGLRRSSTLGASGSRGGHPPSPQLKKMGPKLHAAQVKASVTGKVKTEKQVGEGSCFVHTLW